VDFFPGNLRAFTVKASAQASAAGRIILARVTGEVSLTEKATKVTTAAVNNQEISPALIDRPISVGGTVACRTSASRADAFREKVPTPISVVATWMFTFSATLSARRWPRRDTPRRRRAGFFFASVVTLVAFFRQRKLPR